MEVMKARIQRFSLLAYITFITCVTYIPHRP
jgi:hypothetical protein